MCIYNIYIYIHIYVYTHVTTIKARYKLDQSESRGRELQDRCRLG